MPVCKSLYSSRSTTCTNHETEFQDKIKVLNDLCPHTSSLRVLLIPPPTPSLVLKEGPQGWNSTGVWIVDIPLTKRISYFRSAVRLKGTDLELTEGKKNIKYTHYFYLHSLLLS